MAEDNNKDPMMNEGNGNPKIPKFNVYWVYIIIILGFFLLQYFYSGKTAQLTSWQEVKNQMLANHEVSKLLVIRNAGKVEVYIKEDKLEKYKDRLGQGFGAVPKAGPHFYFTIGSIETFERQAH